MPRKASAEIDDATDETPDYSGHFTVKEFFSMSFGGNFLIFNPGHRYNGANGLGEAIMATDKAAVIDWE